MFFTYLRRELRRRIRQVIFISLGLAVGIGLVITVTAASAGVAQAQSTVLHSLYGVGTDITVTKAPAANSGGPFGFRVRGPARSIQVLTTKRLFLLGQNAQYVILYSPSDHTIVRVPTTSIMITSVQ